MLPPPAVEADRVYCGGTVTVTESAKADWEKSGAAFDGICKDIVEAMGRDLSPDSSAVQGIIRRHYQWLTQFWTPVGQSYAGYGDLVLESELRKAYEAYHPRLPEFAAAAMKTFAKKELPLT